MPLRRSRDIPQIYYTERRRPEYISSLQVAAPFDPELWQDPPAVYSPNGAHEQEARDSTYLCGYQKKTFVTLVCVLILATLAVILGPVLTSTVGKNNINKARSNSLLSNATSGGSNYGVYNGTGMVALDLNTLTNGSRLIEFYYQHFSGEIRVAQRTSMGWLDGTDIVASNAKNGTPVMAVSYEMEAELTWHVIYVDVQGYLQERINSNLTNGWYTGTLGNAKFKAADSPYSAISACWSYEWYGLETNVSRAGIRMYFGSKDGVQEVGWTYGTESWTKLHLFPNSNGNGGVECTVRGLPVTNVWLENASNGQLEQWWYDFNASAVTATHPVLRWTKGLFSSSIRPNSSISVITESVSDGSRFVHSQTADGTIQEMIATGYAETSAWNDNAILDAGKGMAGTRLACVIIETEFGGDEVHVFFQTNATNVVESVRTLEGSSWERLVPLDVGQT